MKDYLKELCMIAEIELIYNDNKLVVLSSGVKNGKPLVRAHNLFSSAPREIAKAVVSYYTGIDSKGEELLMITNYAINCLNTSRIKVLPPEGDFTIFFRTGAEEKINKIVEEDRKSPGKVDENIKEAKVKSITHKDFYGNISSSGTDNKVDTGGSDFIELDIIIDRYKA